MTLTVSAFAMAENGERVDLPLQSDLAGFESTRKTFYAGQKAIDAGLVLLPTLHNNDIMVCGADVELLRKEVEVMRALLSADEAQYWNFRLDNILAAIEAAGKYGTSGGVLLS